MIKNRTIITAIREMLMQKRHRLQHPIMQKMNDYFKICHLPKCFIRKVI